jgi:transposase
VDIFKLTVSKSKNAASLYVAKSFYHNGTRSSKTIEKLGTEAELRKKYPDRDPYEWAQEYIDELNRKEAEKKKKNETPDILIKYSPTKLIPKNEQRLFNGGYLVLQRIYHALGLDKICKQIKDKHQFEYDLNAVLSRLVYARIIYPSSKLATCQISKRFLEQPGFELQHVYRGLAVIAEEMDFIQAELYKKSAANLAERNTGVLYYDCTNYFFEIEQEDGLKQYGYSKEHRPNPIVQMGLFMDGDGIPLAFVITEGNKNEQLTMKPLEQKILADFGLAKFVVCTDAGLSSLANRQFNNIGERAFITTQSVKKLKDYLKGWALSTENWRLPGDEKTYDISELYRQAETGDALDQAQYIDKVFYKERWVNDNGLNQRLVVTFSLKYRNYQRQIRVGQIGRAQKLIDAKPSKLKKSHQNDYKRFILKKSVTAQGEEAKKTILSIDEALIAKEEIYDGFYAVCTNLEDSVEEIIAINRRRWEIEESFRIMKHEFKARPVFLRRDDRIKAHFATCFISLVLFRYLEKILGEKHTCCEIVNTLRGMDFLEAKGEGYIPAYTRTDLTDAIHTVLGERTDYEIVSKRQMKAVFKSSKKK